MQDNGFILYEYPCSEKIRFYMRLEMLRKRLDWYLDQDSSIAHQASINTLFDLSDVAARSDLKNELMKELLQQRRELELRGNAAQEIEEIAAVSKAVSSVVGRTGQNIRDNEWLQIVRNRQQLPGGTCEFDLPQLHFWLSRPYEERRNELEGLAVSLRPVTQAAELILRHIRSRTKESLQTAERGMLQLPVAGQAHLLARIWMPAESSFIPEVNANKYMLWIRFSKPDSRRRLHVVHESIKFRLGLCD